MSIVPFGERSALGRDSKYSPRPSFLVFPSSGTFLSATLMSQSAQLVLRKTGRFYVWEIAGSQQQAAVHSAATLTTSSASAKYSPPTKKLKALTLSSSSSSTTLPTSAAATTTTNAEPYTPIHSNIYLDINDEYTLEMYLSLLPPSHYKVSLGPCAPLDLVSTPPFPSSSAASQNITFHLGEYERIDWEQGVLQGMYGASNYCTRKGLARKAQMAVAIARAVSRRLGSVPSSRSSSESSPPSESLSLLAVCVPYTIVIETWDAFDETSSGATMADGMRVDFGGVLTTKTDKLAICLGEARKAIRDAEEGGEEATWILKPSNTNKGAGIDILYTYEELFDYCLSEPDIREWVLQRYVDRPLLLSGRKFHIRAYALAVGAIKVYVYGSVLCLCSGTQYDYSNASNYFAHITNTAYQAQDPGFVEERCILLLEDMAAVLAEQGTCSTLEEANGRCRKVMDDVRTITGELFACYKGDKDYVPLPGCFEHYGIDYLVDEEFNVKLLEVNPGPDFKQSGNRLRGVILGMLSETVDLTVGRGKLPEDAKFKCVYEHVEERRSYAKK